MCIAIHSDGHLNIKLLYEQNSPKLDTDPETKDDFVQFTESYDIFFRNYSQHALEHLYVLSPYHPTNKIEEGKYVYKLLSPDQTRQFDWIFKEVKDIDGVDNGYRVILTSSSPDNEELKLEATRLNPQPPVLMFQENFPVAGTLVGTGMTLMQIKFEGEQKIEPYDPTKSIQTTYWLRLSYEPEIDYSIKPDTKFGPPGGPFVRVRPCRGYSSEAVLRSLNIELSSLVHKVGKKLIGQTKDMVFKNIFYKPRTSTTICDHRIALITDQNFLVLNPNVEGPCKYAGMDSIEKKPAVITRTWFAGGEHFWETDVATAARRIYSFINEPAFAEQALPLEKISMATGLHDYNNLCHVIAALKEIELVIEPKAGYYLVGPKGKTNGFLIEDTKLYNKMKLRDTYDKVLSILSGPYRFTRSEGKITKFVHPAFTIEYELVFA